MDIKHCFQVLGIEQTKDEAEIKWHTGASW